MGVVEHSPQWKGISLKTLSLALLTVQFSAFILLLHYSRVMPTTDGHRYLPSTAVFLVEVLKLAACLTISFYEISLTMPRSTPATTLFSTLGSTVFSGDSWKMAIPAGLYTLANSLQYVGISNLDAATFQVAYQMKIIVTAIFSVFMLRKKLKAQQWTSLVLLMAGVAIVSIPQGTLGSLASSHHARVYIPRSINPIRQHFGMASGDSPLAKRSATYEGIEEDELALSSPTADASFGLLAVMGVCVFSGWAGVYFEKVIKESPKTPSIWMRNVQLSTYSLFPAFFIGVIFLDGETVAKNGFFDGYNWVVILSIFVQTFGAILAPFCIFYADNISKNFAVSISMVLSSLASFLFFDFSATGNFLFGTSVVLLATYLYSVQEYQGQRPPTIRIHSYEKTTIDKTPLEQNDISIKLPKTPLTSEAAMTTSRPGSPNHKKRKSDNLGYFTKHHD